MKNLGPIRPFAFVLGVAAIAAACGPGGGGPGDGTASPTPTVSGSPTPPPTPTPPPETTLRFVAVGDTGTGEEPAYLVASAIGDKCAADGCDFVTLLGDNIYPDGVTSTTDSDWGPKVAVPYETLGIPLWAILGNHDYGSNGDAFDRPDYEIAYGQTHPLWHMPARHYAHEAENTVLLALDTNLALFDQDDEVAKQTLFAASVLDAADPRWKIALGHHPYLSNGDHGNAGSYSGHPVGSIGAGKHVKELYDAAICGKVDVMLTAHDHSRQVLPGTEACPTLNVVSGGGGEQGTLPGSNPFLFQNRTNGFAYFVVTPDRLRIEMVDVSGTVDYVLELER